jgi:magnesium-protoporphyrin O-methyltransferase
MSNHCCDFGAVAESQFSPQIAARDLDSYRKKGPGATTRLLRDELVAAGANVGSLLDIGTGIGALMFEMFDAGVTRATAVDASPAYIGAASREATRRGRFDAVEFVTGDFLEKASGLDSAATVTLDRVVCCYPAYEPLLAAAVAHADRHFAFSYPRDLWYVRAWNAAINSKRSLTHNPFRTFIHAARQMESLLERAGFRIVSRRKTWTWAIDVYARRT